MKSISPGRNKYFGILLVLVSILYFSTRLFHLTILPIFNDEANYIFWAKNIAVTNKHWFFILTDGKPPFPHWAMVFFLKLLPTQMFLAAGRLPSVFAGFLSLIGVYFLTVELFDRKRIAFFAAIFYLFCPFILFHDRMALFDAFLNSALIWTVLFFIRACKSNNWADFLAWGFLQGVALLSKPTAIIYWALLPTGYIFLKIARIKKEWKRIFKRVFFVLILGEIIHNGILIFSRGYMFYIARPFGYVSTSEITGISGRLKLLWLNLLGSIDWLWAYYTWPIFVLGLASLFFLLYSKGKTGFVIVGIWLFPILILSLLGAQYLPRYILFTTPYFMISLGYLIYEISRRIPKPVSLIMIGTLLCLPVRFDLLLLTDPPSAPLPDVDRYQYVTGHASSYGFEPIYGKIDQQLKVSKVLLLVHGGISHFPNAFTLRYFGNGNIKIIDDQKIENLIALSKTSFPDREVLFVLSDKGDGSPEIDYASVFGFEISAVGKKPEGKGKVYLATL